MKRVLPEYEYSSEQLNIISSLAKDCGLLEDTVKILYGRGITTREEILRFIKPSGEHFISPFKMSGMSEAVELITRARDEDWAVVVYGDYDADGICAATIMGNNLRDFGIEPVLCVPERNNGYGLSKELIDGIFDEYFPQLIITVDCGISCAEEVEYIKEQGAEVIVTDHHELPEKIPDCICINPKFDDGYIYDNLCGAGVAFKVGVALNGKKAYDYLDFAAIATIADSVPLLGENRDIVYEGLKLINEKPRLCYSLFVTKGEGDINSQNVAFSIAPKINAAGRMNNARAALQLFNESDEQKVRALADRLSEYNVERQSSCEELYKSAKAMLAEKSSIGKAILLYNEEWNAGFVGIVAARLAEEYSRPAILFVKRGDLLKGSARSVEGISIFDALKSCEKLIDEYGGHSQAAGVGVKLENFEELDRAINDYLSQRYHPDDFIPTVCVCGHSEQFSPRFAREIELLEPFGVGNKRPLFMQELQSVKIKSAKNSTAHLSFKSDLLDYMFFGGSKFSKLMESAAPKRIIYEYNISLFRGREYMKGLVRDVIYDKSAGRFAESDVALNTVSVLALTETVCAERVVSRSEAQKIIDSCSEFGTLFIATEYATLSKFSGLGNFAIDLFTPSVKSCATSVLISPLADCDLSSYKQIVYLDNPCGVRLASLAGKEVFICEESGTAACLKKLSVDRNLLLKIFADVAASAGVLAGNDAYEVSANILGFDRLQALFALEVFSQLSLIKIDGKVTVFRGVRSNLENSPLYNTVKNILVKQ